MASRPFKRAIALLATASITPAANAFFPFVTDDTGTQGQGGSQIEVVYEFTKAHNDELDLEGRVIGTSSGVSNGFPATYTYGITDNFDVFLGVARQTSPVNGWMNTEIGTKWVFLGSPSTGWSAAIKPIVILPVTTSMQDQGLGNAKTNAGLTLISSYISGANELHLNIGYQSNLYADTDSSEAQRKSLWRVSAAPVYVINDQWKTGIDLGLETNPAYSSNYQAFGEIGIQYAPAENLQIGLGVIGVKALNSTDNSWSFAVTSGVSYQF